MYVCVYIYIYTHVYTCVYTYMCIYIYIYVYTCGGEAGKVGFDKGGTVKTAPRRKRAMLQTSEKKHLPHKARR